MLAKLLLAIAIFLFATVATTHAQSSVLYDGSLGTTPDQQGWVLLMDPRNGITSTQVARDGVTILDSMAVQNDKIGYFAASPRPDVSFRHPGLPPLDRNVGFTIRLDIRIVEEVHRVDRAGFGIIALSHDLRGVELEFWKDEVWMQADQPLFTHGEGVKFDTASAIVAYELRIQGSEYRVSANGAEILSGPLRDYSSFGPPYSMPGFVFIGDDTTTAAARVEIARVEVSVP